ncbi:Nse1 non-SMC component of SMC5-6 complex-domain-containing protein [Circinella umbellata]|nr:Nse1 non-SMC component of SMC5-6 complex-domain-containing protein [Circinella umbellata]
MSTGYTISSAPNQNPTEYGDSHRLFMQSMLSHRILPLEKAHELYFKICDLTQSERVEFDDFFNVINAEIGEIDLALRTTNDERDGSTLLGLVNAKEDEIAQIATKYTPNEITYFREMLETIITADDEKNAISSMVALRLGQKMKPQLSQKDTQALIDRFTEDGWICLTPDGSSYAIDTRSIMELNSYFREQYGDMIKECMMCYDIVTMGERCELQNCGVRMHRHCADSQFAGGNLTCPSCKTSWSRSNTFGLGLPL